MYVLKDAGTNGAGGIWVVSRRNWRAVAGQAGPLFPEARYVAQEYTPGRLRLWRGRKAHLRVYVLLTDNGAAFVHRQGFLHVANKPFLGVGGGDEGDDEVHITNCCANSHDPEAFAGEVVVDFLDKGGVADTDYSGAWPSITRCIAEMATALRPFCCRGQD